MTKVELRRKFAELAGRLDLVTDYAGADYTDNGADFFLEAGQRELDRMFKYPKEVGRIWNTVAAGTYYMRFQDCRAIQHVWINDDEDAIELKKRDWQTLKNYYSDIVGDTTEDTPEYYSPAYIRPIPKVRYDGDPTTLAFVDSDPDTITDSDNGFVADGFSSGDIIRVSGATTPANDGTYEIDTVTAGTITLISTDAIDTAEAGAAGMRLETADENITGTFFNYVVPNSDSYNAIVFLPPPDETFDVEVQGLFYTYWPDDEDDTSFWMEIHPMISVWAGLYMLEVSYRNTTGANDWMAAITRTGSGIDKDTVEEALADDGDLIMEG